jgi:hypothetical protein
MQLLAASLCLILGLLLAVLGLGLAGPPSPAGVEVLLGARDEAPRWLALAGLALGLVGGTSLLIGGPR